MDKWKLLYQSPSGKWYFEKLGAWAVYVPEHKNLHIFEDDEFTQGVGFGFNQDPTLEDIGKALDRFGERP